MRLARRGFGRGAACYALRRKAHRGTRNRGSGEWFGTYLALRRKAHRGMKKTRYAFAVSQKLYIFVL